MKMKVFGSVFVLIAIVALSCSAQADSELATENQSVESEPIDEVSDSVLETDNLAADWDDFKNAIRQKDTEALKKRSTVKIKDHESLIYMLSELFVLKKMDETPFDQLEAVTKDGQDYLQFYAEDIGIDEFGYEYGTAITLYFLETSEGLYLDDYSAAG